MDELVVVDNLAELDSLDRDRHFYPKWVALRHPWLSGDKIPVWFSALFVWQSVIWRRGSLLLEKKVRA